MDIDTSKKVWWQILRVKFMYLSRPSSIMASSALLIFCKWVREFGRRRRAAYISVSLTVKFGKSTSSCVTNPILHNPPSSSAWGPLSHL
jgi:hypothetical protein